MMLELLTFDPDINTRSCMHNKVILKHWLSYAAFTSVQVRTWILAVMHSATVRTGLLHSH